MLLIHMIPQQRYNDINEFITLPAIFPLLNTELPEQ